MTIPESGAISLGDLQTAAPSLLHEGSVANTLGFVDGGVITAIAEETPYDEDISGLSNAMAAFASNTELRITNGATSPMDLDTVLGDVVFDGVDVTLYYNSGASSVVITPDYGFTIGNDYYFGFNSPSTEAGTANGQTLSRIKVETTGALKDRISFGNKTEAWSSLNNSPPASGIILIGGNEVAISNMSAKTYDSGNTVTVSMAKGHGIVVGQYWREKAATADPDSGLISTDERLALKRAQEKISEWTPTGLNETVSTSTSSTSSTTSYTHQGATNTVDGYGTQFHYTSDDNAAINTWWTALQAAGAGTAVTFTLTNGTTTTFTTSSFAEGFTPPGYLRIEISGSGIGDFSGSLTSLSFGGTTYDVTLTGTQNPIFSSSKPVTVNGVVYAPGDWTVSGTSASKTFDADPSMPASVTAFQQPAWRFGFDGTTYELSGALAAAEINDGLMSKEDKAKLDDRVYLDTPAADPGGFISLTSGSLAQYKLIGSTSTYYGSGTEGRQTNIVLGHEVVTTGTIDTNARWSHNVIFGRELAGYNTTASHGNAFNNIIIGEKCLANFGAFSYNVAIGQYALEGHQGSAANTASISSSVAIGTSAGRYSTGDFNTFIGSQTGAGTTNTASSVTCIGHQAGSNSSPSGNITSSNVICLGNNSVTDIYCADTTISSSDGRDKTDVEDFSAGLSFIEALRPVTYRWDKRSSYLDGDDPEASILDITPDGTHKKDRVNLGFIAQEVEEIEKAHGYANDKNDRLISSLNEDETAMGVKYERLIPVLVNAVKELSAANAALEARIAALEGN